MSLYSQFGGADRSWNSSRWLWRVCVKRVPIRTSLLFLGILLEPVTTALVPLFLSKIFSDLTDFPAQLSNDVLFFFTFSVGSIGLTFVKAWLRNWLSNKWMLELRVDFLHQITQMATSDSMLGSGEIMTRINQDISRFVNNIIGLVELFMGSLLALCSVLAIGFTLDLGLTTVLIGGMIIYSIIPFLSKGKLMRLQHATQDSATQAMSWTIATVRAILETRYFGPKFQEWNKVNNRNVWERYTNLSTSQANLSTAINGLQSIVSLAITASILVLGILKIHNGLLSGADLITFVLYSDNIRTPVTNLSSIPTSLSTIRVSSERLGPYFTTPQFGILPGVTGDSALVIRGLDITGAKGPLIRNFTAEIPINGILVVTGSNGNGKTRLIKTLLHQALTEKGTIAWNSSLSADQIHYIPQKVPIFNTTLYENLTLGINESRKYLVGLLRELGWEGRINLDEPYSDSRQPSGGQSKRIGLIRALLCNPKVLVVDEVESGVDDPIRLISAMRKAFNLIVVISHNPTLWEPFDWLWTIKQNTVECTTIRDGSRSSGGT